ncbi:MAG: TonB-dependent receptor [Cytophagales bacterium]|nr:TonB-dependent receptor [Bernardetiaceae bacterium]MDW8210735.1 TonB-dependent receptor [Cytophagales bacterium]
MDEALMGTRQKALKINLDKRIYGSFAEIGAGQEVAAIFFKAGGASGTIAKTMSAYDMTFSNAIYGEAKRYVCQERLLKMFQHEYDLLVERLDKKRGEYTNFFVFANTVEALNYQRTNQGHGWIGVRFQLAPRTTPNDAVVHVKMHDNDPILQQQALGIIGVNLIYACFYLHDDPEAMLKSLMDNLSRNRIEVDMFRLTGPNFKHVDNRLLSLQLVQHGLTEAAMFGPDGNVLQASEAFYKKNVLVLRGRFRPLTHVNMDMLEKGYNMFIHEQGVTPENTLRIAELTLQDLKAADPEIDEKDFLDRVDILCSQGLTVLISNYQRYHKLIGYLATQTKQQIGVILGIFNLKNIFDESLYEQLSGGILEAFSTLFKKNVRLYVYPFLDQQTKTLYTCENFELPESLRYLFVHLITNHRIRDIKNVNLSILHIISDRVLEMIKEARPGWEEMVPEEVARLIKEKCLFGYPCDKIKGGFFLDAPRPIDALPEYDEPPLL